MRMIPRSPSPAAGSRWQRPAPRAVLALLAVMLGGMSAARNPVSRDPQQTQEESPGRTAARPADELDAGLLRAVYLDLAGRPPFEAERERWLGQGLGKFLDEFLGSEAFWDNWLEEQLYFFLLIDNFRPESGRVASIPADLSAGRIDVRDAIHRIALCSSFDLRNPGADTFVTVVMEQLCGMTVQSSARELEIGKTVYDGEAGRFLGTSGSSQADVVAIAIDSKRFTAAYVEREYLRLLRRQPERQAFSAWCKTLRRDPRAYVSLVRDWLLSDAYRQRLAQLAPQPNRMFVKSLFVDLLDRLPDEDEARRMRTALDGLSDPGPLRAVLARLLLDSGQVAIPAKQQISDPTAWVAAWFPKLLGRAATQLELEVFVSAFHEPETHPETIVYAIVSHPEYHRY